MTFQSPGTEAVRTSGAAEPANPARPARTALRGLVVLFHAIGHGARAVMRWTWHRAFGRTTRAEEALGEELCRLLESLGPAFVKVGQVLSARPDLLPPGIVGPLVRLQNDVRRVSSAQTKAALTRYVDNVGQARFRSLEDQPIAAGSIAQVHRAVLEDGREIALKIRRPGAVRKVTRDLALLSRFARFAEKLPPCRDLPLEAIIAEVSTAVSAQLDFRREAENTSRFRAMFRHQEKVRVPRIHEELCRSGIIAMEYVPKNATVTSGAGDEANRRQTALTGLRALYRMIFDEGFVHADMHPGNVYIGPSGEIVLLDAGLVADLSTKDQKDFVNFFFGLANDDGETCARIVWDTALGRPDTEVWPSFCDAMVDLIASYACLQSRDFEITRFVYDLIELQRRFRIRGSTGFIMTVLSMVVYDGICKTLYPECDFLAEARGFLIHARYRLNSVPETQRVFV